MSFLRSRARRLGHFVPSEDKPDKLCLIAMSSQDVGVLLLGIMENQTEKKMENEMETREYVGNTREYYMDFLTRVVKLRLLHYLTLPRKHWA